ncbi:protein kinase [Candidatus Uabimicrobium amorphum]|uniref:non-specific serine/threonine protein kinase n=1 Tax=Uabimicrobium amorphum TaxID=2596890 RepID=A0A5S9IRT1_UABAM|nr:serine/threonine-protein kinase [Candidatus Uabimicrobium amorphum]BBM86958.1 protein kinase [Candidatus Uabimicrobium amorphum]
MPHFIDKTLHSGEYYTLGPYHIEQKLGNGNMGVVYKATHVPSKTVCAIKILSTKVSEANIRRFQREACSVKRLKHRNIVQVYDFAKINNLYLIAMEFIAGETLDVWLKKNTFFSARLKMFKQIAHALQYAHSHQLIHRDIKPANIMVRLDGEACIMDFGLVKDLQQDKITATGMVMGTPMYMSPEQLKARNVDYRTDIYSLGVILYEMITDSRPFGNSLAETLYAKSTNISPNQQNIEDNLYAICCKAIAFRRNRRYESAKALIEDIERYENNTPVHALEVEKNPHWQKAAIVVVLLFSTVAVYLAIGKSTNSSSKSPEKKYSTPVKSTKNNIPKRLTRREIDTFIQKSSLRIVHSKKRKTYKKRYP